MTIANGQPPIYIHEHMFGFLIMRCEPLLCEQNLSAIPTSTVI